MEGTRLSEFYVRYADGAVRLAYLITGDRTLAEDIMQEAFLRMTGRLLHLRDPGGFEAYLRRTVVNLANSHHRRRAVERRYLARQEPPPAADPPDRRIEELDRLRAALLSLPVRQRTAIVLRFYEDLSEAQIADVMRCPIGTVKSLVARGMKVLRPNFMEGRDGV